jgi:SAM-dependent methyltransferase
MALSPARQADRHRDVTELSPHTTSWANAVRLGVQPKPADLREHLMTVHRANAGFTESCAARCRDSKGRNSYEWLADAVDPTCHRMVLDLACGSGPLLELCHARFGAGVALTGVDMSADELAIAEGRLPEGAVTLHRALAQDLPMIPAGSVDAVLCHWALTLMDPVAPVLEEVSRVLAPGGVFAAIIDGEMDSAPGYREVHDLIYGHVRREFPWYGDIDLGDPRVRRSGTLEALAHDAFAGDSVAVEPGVFVLESAPDTLAREAAGFFYASFVLSPPARSAMLSALAGRLSPAGAPAAFAMPVNRLVVRRQG